MCDCAKKINEHLKKANTRLSTLFAINGETMDVTSALRVATEKIDTKVRKPQLKVSASFCPFCGIKAGTPEPSGLTECAMGVAQ